MPNVNDKKYTAFYILAGIFLLSLVPLLLIARYNIACADDYNYSCWVHYVWENTHSFTEVIKAALVRVKNTYSEWQGSFSAVFVFTLQPAVFGEKFYCVVPVIMLGSLIFATVFFCWTFFGKVLGGSLNSVFIAIVWLFAEIQLLPSAVQGFYWFNGASYYTFFYSISLILFGLIILFSRTDSVIKKFIFFTIIRILSVVVGGSNYVTALLTVLIFTMYLICLIARKNKLSVIFLIPFFLLLTSFFLNIAAPGNAVRQTFYISPGAVKTIINSFYCAFMSIINSANLMLILWIVLLFPILWNIVLSSRLSFRYPLLVLVITFCLYSAQFAPPIYAMGVVEGEERLENIIFYSYIFFLIFNSFYIMGWCKRKFSCERFNRIMYNGIFPSLLLVMSFASLTVYSFIPEKYVTTISAVYSLKEGEAEKYYEEFSERLDILRDTSEQNITFSPYSSKPYLLFFDDITADKDDWRNHSFADYYGKKSITVKTEK